MKLLGIAGALRRASTNKGMLRAAQRFLPPGVELAMADIADLPLYDMDADPFGGDASGARNEAVSDWPPAVARLRDQFTAADAVLVAVGVNNLMVPPALSNALAWLSRPETRGEERIRLLEDKPFALMGSGGGRAGADGREALAHALGVLGADVIDEAVDEAFFGGDFDLETGDVATDDLSERIRSLVAALVARAS